MCKCHWSDLFRALKKIEKKTSCHRTAHCFLRTKYITPISVRLEEKTSCEEWEQIASAPGLSLLWPTGLRSKANCVWRGDDTHRNVNGAEYFRGGIITWQKEGEWVSRKHLVVEVPLCYCKPRVKADFNAQLTRPSCCRGGLRWLSFSSSLCLSLSRSVS